MAIARSKDREPASKRIRTSVEHGRSTILPRTRPLPPITRFAVQARTPAGITAYGRHGFVLGDASGVLCSVTSGGERTPFDIALDGPLTAIDHAAATGRLACATGAGEVFLVVRNQQPPERLAQETPRAEPPLRACWRCSCDR